ncbi:MAG: FxsA family protein [Aldersonia sp.]|nr:FxsA family protein [Aldersonia sp.]
MPVLLFVAYVVVELAAFVWAVNTIGALWTVLLLIAGSFVGMALVRWQWRAVREGFRRAQLGERAAGGAMADGALVGLGAVLMFVPGLVTSVLGLLLLLPPTRLLLRPAAVAVAARRLSALTVVSSGYHGRRRDAVIDGEVVDSMDVTQPRIDPAAHQSTDRSAGSAPGSTGRSAGSAPGSTGRSAGSAPGTGWRPGPA